MTYNTSCTKLMVQAGKGRRTARQRSSASAGKFL
nr:MAG TPA: hypothetical protein [Caudoviricetes sp.]